jgi:hypothetical protein
MPAVFRGSDRASMAFDHVVFPLRFDPLTLPILCHAVKQIDFDANARLPCDHVDQSDSKALSKVGSVAYIYGGMAKRILTSKN